jgi:DNA-binding FrmR family transcriptional regulator
MSEPTSEPLSATPPGGHGYQREERLEDLIRRLRRIEGQVRGLQKMVEEGRYCVDILTQIDAVTAALARVQDQVLESHLNHCVAEALEGEDRVARKKKVDEVVGLLKKYRRSV